MKRCSGLILPLVLLLFSGSPAIAAETSQITTHITCSAQSPVDGSLWMGTDGEGLLRMGRNGRHILYNKTNGQLSSDIIKALSFEAESNILILLDGNGSIWTYTSTEGFKEKKGFDAPVLCLQSSKNGSQHYAATAQKLYKFSSTKDPEMCLELPFPADKIVTGEDESLWIITKDGAFYIDENLNIAQQDGVFSMDVSKSNAFIIETSTPEDVTERKPHPAWLIVALIILACALGAFLFYRLVKSRRTSTPPVQVETTEEVNKDIKEEVEVKAEEKEVVEIKEAKEEVPEVSTANKPAVNLSYQEIKEKMAASTFGATALSIIESHLDDPSFGVEQISEIMGFSRIHLNRRLKAETGFSPSTVIKAARMNQALQLLMDGNHTMAEVAVKCGFSTASYFSTAFKEHFGTTPSDYMGIR